MSRTTRSISGPIILASTSVAVSIALLVFWIIVIVQKRAHLPEPPGWWLLVLGILFFVFIMTSLVLFSVFLVREIREVRRQNTFIDSVTHELKSPLASLKLCVETLHREGITEGHREQLGAMMLADIERLNVFIDDILTASRLPFERRAHTVQEISVLDSVERCVESISRRYKLAGEAISVDVPADLTVNTDDTAFETVLKNLLDNAVKYSDEPVDVRVEASLAEGMVRLSVTDKGIGISPSDRRRIFERFYRAPVESVRARRGTGLGLFVVATLVKSLGGKLDAESGGRGLGTSVHVVLPQQVEA